MKKEIMLYCLMIFLLVGGVGCNQSSKREILNVNGQRQEGNVTSEEKSLSISIIPKDEVLIILNNIKNPIELNEQLLNSDKQSIVDAFIQIEEWTNNALTLSGIGDGSYIDYKAREEIKKKLMAYHDVEHIDKLLAYYYPENPEYIPAEHYGKAKGLYLMRATEAWGTGSLDFANKKGTVSNISVKYNEDNILVTFEGEYKQIDDVIHFKRTFSLIKQKREGNFVIHNSALEEPLGNFPSLPF
ncbi:hypothetical protein P9E76_20530 [Schinkia azotoformans]|uniref:Lipoprotein n=1 Tax=Schinkia azotoformans LMG 9581 TaxID=1131731 RepID=K6DSD5_SCHAZ|nr:hypothetical protein [Schinkia azotoformans]EKN71153.1 hypothetical protein BAZO_00685 [Schinkia azotoformans LMG 9581]MEC1640320.1 hypothetical protein [Schinkia azotoformans]MEC1722088.1 hypothetical protein [Schinkia azotoformans]MEC1947382.1 hypothetical protein [Schinkia azotoformans]MED4415207.1 hypothetical protein [Schinkia azotoformans]